MKQVYVHAGNGYPIYIEKGLLHACGAYIRQVSAARKVCLVSDTNVYPLYGETAAQSLRENGFEVVSYVLPAGEASKTPAFVMQLVTFFAEHGLTRNDLVAALGGGVIGDMAGFAAAIYLRGIAYVQLPTTLLAQADASVGGKTAVNLPQGKNLCGAFHQPALVLTDPETLQTLPPRCFSDGLAEVIKMGCILSKALFERLEKEDAADRMEDFLYECICLKAEITARDEKEHGERTLLNFGHTVGHAIETLHGFQDVTHGEAVGIGMVLICRAAERCGYTPQGTAERIAALLERYQLPTADIHPLSQIVEAMHADKKQTGSALRLVLLHAIGEGYVHPMDNETIRDFFGV